MMNILLDTHSAIWFFEGDKRLPQSAIEAISNLDNMIYVSIASLWEIAIKLGINKLIFDDVYDGFLDALYNNEFVLLNVEPEHIKTTMKLPFIHRDPFDRMLIAQAMVEDMVIMTVDANITKYGVKTIY